MKEGGRSASLLIYILWNSQALTLARGAARSKARYSLAATDLVSV